MSDDGDEDAGISIPIDGTLDLHTFDPREVGELVADYLEACRSRGILEVRIVHGKGTGTLRARVARVLARLAMVESFRSATPGAGDWGATIVVLKPL